MVLRDLLFLFLYLDILVASRSRTEHLSHLKTLFQHLSQHGLIVNPAKCQLGLPSIDFLGHHITRQGAVPLPAKVAAVRNFPQPGTVKALQELLGMVNFYHRFIPHATELMRPLYEALKGKAQRDTVPWQNEMVPAFSDTKQALGFRFLLEGCPFAVFVDHKHKFLNHGPPVSKDILPMSQSLPRI